MEPNIETIREALKAAHREAQESRKHFSTDLDRVHIASLVVQLSKAIEALSLLPPALSVVDELREELELLGSMIRAERVTATVDNRKCTDEQLERCYVLRDALSQGEAVQKDGGEDELSDERINVMANHVAGPNEGGSIWANRLDAAKNVLTMFRNHIRKGAPASQSLDPRSPAVSSEDGRTPPAIAIANASAAQVELKPNDYDALLTCTGCGWAGTYIYIEELEPFKFCPGCAQPLPSPPTAQKP